MSSSVFFKKAKDHFVKGLPFVIYRLPNIDEYRGFFQKNSDLFKSTSFEESGFIFAPYKLTEGAVLFPSDHCEQLQHSENLQSTFPVNNSFISNEQQKESYLSLISDAIKEITKTNLEKVVLSRCLNSSIATNDPINTFKSLASKYPNAFVYCWFHPEVGNWIGATPENLFKVEGNRFSTMSLAGTKESTPTETIPWTNKELEEQKIVTEYLCDQLKDVVSDLTVSEVSDIKAGDLIHLLSKITGKINTTELSTIIERLHPTPAVCGQPKQLAEDFINRKEGYDREYYTGFLGELNLVQKTSRSRNTRNIENSVYSSIRRSTNLFVNLRCAQLFEHEIKIYVGGGITKDSIPEKEWRETVNKSKTIGTVIAF